MKFLFFLGIFIYGSYLIWQKVPYLLITPNLEIAQDIKQVINDTKNTIFNNLSINDKNKPYQICNAIKGRYEITISQSMSFFMGRTFNFVGCSPIDTANKLGCFFEIKLNETIQSMTITGQLCTY